MRLDKYSNPIFTEQDLFDALYQSYQFDAVDTVLVDQRSTSIKQLESQIGFKFIEPYETHFEVSDYDSACQSNWYMPDEYKILDIEAWIWEQTPPWDPQHTRVTEELAAFKERNMMDLLRWLKYFVDTCNKNNVVWGVGRGSSVASYILYLIGVHHIDSIKYNLEWQEFLR
jgi:DNA polymerase III alpha subunit